jgi:hypothetical protein
MLLCVPGFLCAQETRLTIDPLTSLAWWQIDPNFGHLWATTCPDDPSWQAGEGRTPGKRVDFATRKKTKSSGRSDKRVPLYPRMEVHRVCRHAVQGGVLSADTVTWRGTRGEVIILPDSLETGLDMRSAYARRAIFETHKYRRIRFVLDSLSAVQPGDTLIARAHGTLDLHGVHTTISAPLKAWREKEGLRVQTTFSVPADDLTDVYKMSKTALAMGTALGRWNTVHMGVDFILR